MFKLFCLLLLAALSAGACSQSTSGPRRTGIAEEKFVAVMVDLGLSQPHQRDVVLKKHGVTDRQLRSFVQAYAEHPQALGVVFDSIQTTLDRKRLQDQ